MPNSDLLEIYLQCFCYIFLCSRAQWALLMLMVQDPELCTPCVLLKASSRTALLPFPSSQQCTTFIWSQGPDRCLFVEQGSTSKQKHFHTSYSGEEVWLFDPCIEQHCPYPRWVPDLQHRCKSLWGRETHCVWEELLERTVQNVQIKPSSNEKPHRFGCHYWPWWGLPGGSACCQAAEWLHFKRNCSDL